MNRLALEALSPVLNESTQRSRELIDRVAQQVNIDWATGQVNIVNEMAILNAFRDIKGPDSEELAQSFMALLLDGYAVLDAGAAGVDRFGIPWRALFHGPTLDAMTIEGWDLFGINPWSNTNSIRQTLIQKFPQVPDYVLEDDSLDDLVEWAARRTWLDRVNQVMMMGPGGGGRDPKPDPSDPPPSRGANPPKIDPATVKRVAELAKAAAECLMNGEWSVEMALAVFPIGPKVCLDRACADKLENALWADAGAAISAILTSIVSGAAGVPAVLAAVGGWAGLGLLHFSLHWAILINANKTANGVCLIHFFPWISPAFLGILNGYAVGR